MVKISRLSAVFFLTVIIGGLFFSVDVSGLQDPFSDGGGLDPDLDNDPMNQILSKIWEAIMGVYNWMFDISVKLGGITDKIEDIWHYMLHPGDLFEDLGITDWFKGLAQSIGGVVRSPMDAVSNFLTSDKIDYYLQGGYLGFQIGSIYGILWACLSFGILIGIFGILIWIVMSLSDVPLIP